MYCISGCIIAKQMKKRAIAIAFMICFIVVSLLSEAFIWTHTDHVHDHNGIGGSCAVCAQIQNAKNTLKQLGTAVIGSFGIFAGLYAVAAIIKAICFHIAVLTPVTSKVKMNR